MYHVEITREDLLPIVEIHAENLFVDQEILSPEMQDVRDVQISLPYLVMEEDVMNALLVDLIKFVLMMEISEIAYQVKLLTQPIECAYLLLDQQTMECVVKAERDKREFH